MIAHALPRRALDAAQCAVTLVCLLGALGLVAWAAGIAVLGDLPWIMAGAFGGSFVMALVKRDRRTARR